MCFIPISSFGLKNDPETVKRFGAAVCVGTTVLAGGAFMDAPAAAASLWARDGVIHIRGSVERGDADTFRALLRDTPGARLVALDGPGGGLREAMAIGDAVRRARLATLVDGGRVACDSACTLIFAAGVRRHYVNAGDVEEGVVGHYGLGYHLAYDLGSRIRPPMKSEVGIRLMDGFYARMGSRAASALARRASISTLWRPNGATALRLGLATSLAAPVTPTGRR